MKRKSGKRVEDLNTVSLRLSGCEFRFTQWFMEGMTIGHYWWALIDSRGNLVCAGGSSGQPPDRLTVGQVRELMDVAVGEHARRIKVKNGL